MSYEACQGRVRVQTAGVTIDARDDDLPGL